MTVPSSLVCCGASGTAALVGVALCCPSAPAPWSAEAHCLRGRHDLRFPRFSWPELCGILLCRRSRACAVLMPVELCRLPVDWTAKLLCLQTGCTARLSWHVGLRLVCCSDTAAQLHSVCALFLLRGLCSMYCLDARTQMLLRLCSSL